MKRSISTLVLVLFVAIATFAQVPQGVNYQAVLRGSNGSILSQEFVEMTFTILANSPTGNVLYEEKKSLNTSEFGLVTHIIGTGIPVTGVFSSINWASQATYLKTAVNAGAGNIELGSSQFMSVPYALTAGNGNWNSLDGKIYNSNGIGFVGIGTSNPLYPLHVTTLTNESGITGYLYNAFGPGSYGGANMSIGIRSSGAMVCNNFLAQSDERIKTITSRSNGLADLELIKQLKVTDYNYIDQVSLGSKEAKGFIAQEVEAVMPEAITPMTDFIPNVYALASSVESTPNGKWIIRTEKEHQFASGDRVKLITENAGEYTVSEVMDDHTFSVTGLAADTEEVFVYGKEVTDFRSVDYDRIYTTGISAIQELSAQVESLKSENEILRASLEEQSAELSNINAMMTEMKALMLTSETLKP